MFDKCLDRKVTQNILGCPCCGSDVGGQIKTFYGQIACKAMYTNTDGYRVHLVLKASFKVDVLMLLARLQFALLLCSFADISDWHHHDTDAVAAAHQSSGLSLSFCFINAWHYYLVCFMQPM